MAHGATVDYPSSYCVRSLIICRAFLMLTVCLISDSFYKNIVLYMTQFWVGTIFSVKLCTADRIYSFHFSIIFPDKLLMSHGRCRYTTYFLRFCLLSLSVFSI